MRKILIGLVGLICLIRPVGTVRAIYDPLSVPNNKFGIHILEPAEIGKAAEFVNSSGGEWGYVTIPIRANDRDLEKWTKFMEQARALKVIPILRIATFPVESGWAAPNDLEILSFANFLDQLPWPTKNRYVVVYNEPNHPGEWGGFVDPTEYARVLDRAVDLFRQVHGDFFLISAGMDASQTNLYRYYQQMQDAVGGIFNKVDGLAFHAYGNPGFTAPPNIYSPVNVASFRFELKYLKVQKPIFITEAGWKNPADWFFPNALTYAWNDPRLVALTPFLLDGGDGPFSEFSFLDSQKNWKPFAKTLISLPKTAGKPWLAETPAKQKPRPETLKDSSPPPPAAAQPNFLEKLLAFLRNLFL